MNYFDSSSGEILAWSIIAYFLIPIPFYKWTSKWFLKTKWNLWFYSMTNSWLFAVIFASAERNQYFDGSFMPTIWSFNFTAQLFVQLIFFIAFYLLNWALEKAPILQKPLRITLHVMIYLALLSFTGYDLFIASFLNVPELVFSITSSVLLIGITALLLLKPFLRNPQ